MKVRSASLINTFAMLFALYVTTLCITNYTIVKNVPVRVACQNKHVLILCHIWLSCFRLCNVSKNQIVRILFNIEQVLAKCFNRCAWVEIRLPDDTIDVTECQCQSTKPDAVTATPFTGGYILYFNTGSWWIRPNFYQCYNSHLTRWFKRIIPD